MGEEDAPDEREPQPWEEPPYEPPPEEGDEESDIPGEWWEIPKSPGS